MPTKLQSKYTTIVLIGVSGCGKSSVGKLLAQKLCWTFVDADDYHSEKSVQKMRSGVALSDEDRESWLKKLAAILQQHLTKESGNVEESFHAGCVLACSCLKKQYRDVLCHPSLLFVHLQGSRDVIQQRMQLRADHFMPVSLLDSQFETMEELEADENGIMLSIEKDISDIVDDIIYNKY